MVKWQINSIIAGINILLILGLLYVYAGNLKKVRSGFTFGLLMFALLFLFHNILVFYFSITMMPLYAEGVSPFMLAFTGLQAIAFGCLNYITWK